MKIAVFADLHLPDDASTVKEVILDWAIAQARKLEVNGIACIGDMTAFGTFPAARRLAEKLRRSGIPFWFTPGNAELRQGNDPEVLLQTINADPPPDDILLLDTSRGRLNRKTKPLPNHNRLALTHYPPDALPEEDRELIQSAIDANGIAHLVAGHIHCDQSTPSWDTVRGLDPDKAIGGPPGFAVFSRRTPKEWVRENIDFRIADASLWPAEQRWELLECLGISGMENGLENIQFAIVNRIPVYELRYQEFPNLEMDVLQGLIEEWRHHGGRVLSLHLPEIRWAKQGITGVDQVKTAVKLAISLGCDRVTFHVPGVSLKDFSAPAVYDRILHETVSALRTLVSSGIVIGIENLHMRPEEKNDMDRGFGYTIEECRAWVETLRSQMNSPLVGFHFDLGHARNNVPYSSTQPISSWFAAMGTLINGYHLHQVKMKADNVMENHEKITAPFDALISLASLLTAWQMNRITHAPLILEIRHGGGPESYTLIRKFIAKE